MISADFDYGLIVGVTAAEKFENTARFLCGEAALIVIVLAVALVSFDAGKGIEVGNALTDASRNSVPSAPIIFVTFCGLSFCSLSLSRNARTCAPVIASGVSFVPTTAANRAT